MQITQRFFEQSPNQAWQYSQKEPVLIGNQDDKRVLISYEFYQELLNQYHHAQKSNSQRLGMSLADLEKSGDMDFGRHCNKP